MALSDVVAGSSNELVDALVHYADWDYASDDLLLIYSAIVALNNFDLRHASVEVRAEVEIRTDAGIVAIRELLLVAWADGSKERWELMLSLISKLCGDSEEFRRDVLNLMEYHSGQEGSIWALRRPEDVAPIEQLRVFIQNRLKMAA